MNLSPITGPDLPDVHALNQVHVPHLGPVDLAAMEALWRASEVAVLLRDEEGVAGFLLAMAPGAPYASPNFRWFCDRGGRFLYVDRIAVAPRRHGQGLGRRLYEAAFDAALRRGFDSVTCEVNTLPPNPGSLAFHARLGFQRIGELVHEPGQKAVALLEVAVAPR